ncbi:ABC transporter permease [Plantibacter sp. YIM 135249]|uniref:ABC transporter permease n=1 Tax=Plantibacter sp. YIM 135249 TaxID=3423918 RepID=UPI003D33A32A
MRFAARFAARFGGLIVVFVGVTLIIYLMVFALPGDPVRALGGDRPLSPTAIEVIRERFHLDEPVLQQYLRYLGGLFQGDFGVNFSGRPVAEQMAARWPVTITLALTAWCIEIVVGLGLGVLAALKQGTIIDRAILWSTILASAIPVFVVGSIAQLVFGVRLGWFPVAGTSAGWPTAYVLPAAVIALFGLAAVARLMRGSILENLNADFVTMARAKGLPESRVVGVHVMRNSLIPASTYLATDLGYLFGGTVIIEGIFNLPGIGNLLFQAIRAHEGPTIVGVSTALILAFLLTSIAVDFIQAALDPRVRRG